jgi:DNA-binding response OmpR family regulator
MIPTGKNGKLSDQAETPAVFLKDSRLPGRGPTPITAETYPLRTRNGRPCLLDEVLIIDDSPDTRKIVKRALESVGFFVHEAESAEEGIYKTSMVPSIRLIFLDLSLPKLPGLAALCELRKIRMTAQATHSGNESRGDGGIRICVLTSTKDESVIDLAFQNGADDYMIKPFFSEGLVSKAGMLIKNREIIEMYHVRSVFYHARLLHSEICPDLEIVAIDELSLTIRSTADFLPEKMMVLGSPLLLKDLGLVERNSVRVKVNRSSRKARGHYILRARYVGISEEEDRRIRAFVIGSNRIEDL